VNGLYQDAIFGRLAGRPWQRRLGVLEHGSISSPTSLIAEAIRYVFDAIHSSKFGSFWDQLIPTCSRPNFGNPSEQSTDVPSEL